MFFELNSLYTSGRLIDLTASKILEVIDYSGYSSGIRIRYHNNLEHYIDIEFESDSKSQKEQQKVYKDIIKFIQKQNTRYTIKEV